MADKQINFPADLKIDYQEKHSRVTTIFRGILAIPIIIVLVLLIGSYASKESSSTAIGFIVLPTLLMILFRMKYPKWWFNFNLELIKFCARVNAYLLLLRDEYPSTDEEQAVKIKIDYPDVKKDLNRWLPLVKWLLAIPHYIVLAFLFIGLIVLTVLAWFAIIFTGKYPKSFFEYNIGVLRWCLRVECYSLLLTTDKYPPFSLK
jgi:hypothetical protein